MNFFLVALSLLLSAPNLASSFVPHTINSKCYQSIFFMTKKSGGHRPSANDINKNKLTANDIINRARKAAGMPEMEEAPKLFTDELYDDMQKSLQQLEQRVKQGPGSLSVEQVQEFEDATSRILAEMKAKLLEGSQQNAPAANSQQGFESATPNDIAASLGTTSSSGYGTTDLSNDEGPAYDGTGGMGVARGTRNTYVIPGMDEMSPEEYRKALQESVSNRQTRRRSNLGGVVGNRAALQYLDNLGWGGSASNWKSNEDDDEVEEQ